jgi:hypothetical protein
VCTCASAFGQEKKPEAYLRVSHECAEWVQDAATGRTACQKFKSHSDPEKFFSIEIYMPVRLAEATYNSLKGVPVKDKDGVVKKVEKPVLGVLFVDDEEKPEYKIEISPYDSQRLPAVDESNPAPSYGRTRFVIYLPKTFNTTQSLSVSLDRYTIDVPVNETKDRRFIVGVKKEFTAALTTKADVRGCYKQLTARVAYNNEQTVIYLPELGMRQLATRKQVPLKYLADPTLPASAPLTESDIDASHYQKYVKWRIGTIYDWLNQLKGDSNRLSNVRFAVEDVSVILKPPAELNAVEQDGNLTCRTDPNGSPKRQTCRSIKQSQPSSCPRSGKGRRSVKKCSPASTPTSDCPTVISTLSCALTDRTRRPSWCLRKGLSRRPLCLLPIWLRQGSKAPAVRPRRDSRTLQL